MEKYFLETLNK